VTEENKPTAGGLLDELPTDRLKQELRDLAMALAQRATKAATGKLPGLARSVGKSVVGGTGGLAKKVAGAGVDKVKEAVTGGGGGGKQGQKGKVTNIVEDIDVGVPVSVAYNQWTQFTDFPDFMKKVETVEQESDTELKWRAQILWSHREWKSTIVDQVPEKRIVWRSEGDKGYVDGAVTFHELGPNLTKVMLVLEYYPQGFFEHVGNLWRAQGRRARLELKHFRRHVMTQVALHPEELEGWRGEIHDSEVTRSHEDAVRQRKERAGAEAEEGEAPRAEGGEEPEAEAGHAEQPEGEESEAEAGERGSEESGQPEGDRRERAR
jgi:uncharacterized membrane protein